MIKFSCPSCQKLYSVADNLAGRSATCKNCGNKLQVPSPTDESSAEVRQPAAKPPTAPAPTSSQPAANAVLKGATDNFEYEITQRPDFSFISVNLPQGKQIFAEPSAMASMSPSIGLKVGFQGGLKKTLGKALGGESLIINTFTADEGPGEVTFAAGVPGDAAHYKLDSSTLYLQRGAFMLHSEGVELTGKWQGAKGFFGGEGLVLLKASGSGDIFFNSYGAILAVDVTDNYIVDSGYIVAFEDTLQYKVTVLPGLRAGGKLKSFFFGGEGLVCQFSGQGRVWIQTRHVQSFLSWVHPFRQTKSN